MTRHGARKQRAFARERKRCALDGGELGARAAHPFTARAVLTARLLNDDAHLSRINPPRDFLERDR